MSSEYEEQARQRKNFYENTRYMFDGTLPNCKNLSKKDLEKKYEKFGLRRLMKS